MTAAETSPDLACGVYQHYKGDHYLVLGVARDDRDDSMLVIYVRLYGRTGVPMTARPLDGFLATVDTPEGPAPRFRYVGSSSP